MRAFLAISALIFATPASAQDGMKIGLSEMIVAVKQELLKQEAISASMGLPPMFCRGPVNLELQFSVTTTTQGGGGVQIFVVSLGADHQSQSAAVQKVTLTLEPLLDCAEVRRMLPDWESTLATQFPISTMSAVPPFVDPKSLEGLDLSKVLVPAWGESLPDGVR